MILIVVLCFKKTKYSVEILRDMKILKFYTVSLSFINKLNNIIF